MIIKYKNAKLIREMGTKIGLILLILTVAISIPLAFADDFGDVKILSATDKSFYETGELLFFSGQVEEKTMPILALRVYDPHGVILSANNVEIKEDSTFSKMIPLNSPFYDELGTYLMKIDYGKLQKEITFEIISDNFFDETIFFDFEEPLTLEIITLDSDKEIYTDNDIITITGSVSLIEEPSVLIGIHDPFGTPTGFYFGTINSDNEFIVSFLAKAGVNFKVDGTYDVTTYYGDSKEIAYFDFIELVKYLERHQTPATPAISLLYALDRQLDHMLAEGMENRTARHAMLRDMTIGWARSRGFTLFATEGSESPTVTCINNDLNVSVEHMNGYLRHRGFIISNGYGPLKEETFRIAHMGDTTTDDLTQLLDVIDAYLSKSG